LLNQIKISDNGITRPLLAQEGDRKILGSKIAEVSFRGISVQNFLISLQAPTNINSISVPNNFNFTSKKLTTYTTLLRSSGFETLDG
jgi:hypothetical protein